MVHRSCSSCSSAPVQSTIAAEYLKIPMPLLLKIWIAMPGECGWCRINSTASLVLCRTISLVCRKSPFAVAQNPRYLTGSCSGTVRMAWPWYVVASVRWRRCLSPSTIMSIVFFRFSGMPLHSSKDAMTFIRRCMPLASSANIDMSSQKQRQLNISTPFTPCAIPSACPTAVSMRASALMKMRKRIGERTDPCATPVSNVIVALC